MTDKPSAQDLADAFQEIDQHDLGLLQNIGQSTAHLTDENDPNSPVVIRDEKGNDRLIMPRSTWDELRAQKP